MPFGVTRYGHALMSVLRYAWLEGDRRGELSKFKTVQHALADRERIEKGKATKAKAKTKKK
jgi:hypothetical protein